VIQALCFTVWRRISAARFTLTLLHGDGGSAARLGQRLVLRFTSTYRHVKGDGSFLEGAPASTSGTHTLDRRSLPQILPFRLFRDACDLALLRHHALMSNN
jgi:hypothetical protein